MKNKFIPFLMAMLACSPLCAQKNIIKPVKRALMGPVRAEFTQVPGRAYQINYFDVLLGHEQEPVGRTVLGSTLQNTRIESEFYGITRAARDKYLHNQLRTRWVNQWKRFTPNREQVQKAVKSRLFGYQPIAYDKVFDFSSRWIFLGERHGHTPITEEITSFVANFARRHPDTPVYLATEFINTHDDFGKERLFIRTREDLARYENDLAGDMRRPFYELIDNNVSLVGLEDWKDFQHQADQAFEKGEFDMRLPSPLEYEYRLARSLWGVEHRNQMWAKRLNQLRRQVGPQAYIFVYAGAGHVNRSIPGNLPSMLRQNASPVITFSVYGDNPIDFFLWDGYLRPQKEDLLGVPCTPKNCPHPQKLFMWHKKPEYAQLLGCDGRVWFF